MRRGRRSARTLSTMLATSVEFSLGGVGSGAVCSAPAATAMAADAAGALNSRCFGSGGAVFWLVRAGLGLAGIADMAPAFPGGRSALNGFGLFFRLLFVFLGKLATNELRKGVARW